MTSRFYSLQDFSGAKKCVLKNGTNVFYVQNQLDCSCLAPIPRSPDFGGIAIVVAFLVMAWGTIFISFIPTIYSVSRQWNRTSGPKKFLKWLWAILQFEENHQERDTRSRAYPSRFSDRDPPPSHGTASSIRSTTTYGESQAKEPLPSSRPFNNLVDDEPTSCAWARRMLFKLCDIQIITGTAVLIAALANQSSLTFYHAQLASQYWWLCLNSWWTSRIDYSRTDPAMTTWRAHLRRCSIFISVALSIALQVIITIREQFYWNPIDPGKCYTSDAAGSSYFQNILWLTATCLYFAIITLSLFPVTRNWFDHNVNDKVGPSLVFMNRKFLESIQNFNLYRENSSSCTTSGSVSKSITLLYLGIKTVFIAVAWISWWLFVLVCSILVSGNSSAALEVLIYSGIAAAITWWIVFLEVKNRFLLQGGDEKWTFGSALMCLLFLIVAFHGLDVYAAVKRDEYITRRRQKHDEEDQETSPKSAMDDSGVPRFKEVEAGEASQTPSENGHEAFPNIVEKDIESRNKI